MANMQLYYVTDADWASSSEMVVNDPERGQAANLRLNVESRNPVQFVLFVASTPDGKVSSNLDTRLALLDSNLIAVSERPQDSDIFVSDDRRVAILVNPHGQSWTASIEQGLSPFAVNGLAFHPSVSALPRVGGPPPRGRCRVCKSTAKALALAIVAAAGFTVAPAALIASVSLFLGGVGVAAAAAFLTSVLGDTADVIANKLCERVGLCP